MNCIPSCEILLPEIGKARIYSKMDICKSPGVLTIGIDNSERNSVSFFDAGPLQHYRKIGSDSWPLQLEVNFRNIDEDRYYADACIKTLRKGKTTCFMHGYIDSAVDNVCGNRNKNNGFPTTATSILCVILALMISAVVITIFYRLYASYKLKNNRKSSCCNLKTAKEISPKKENNELIDFIDAEAKNIIKGETVVLKLNEGCV